MKTRAERLPHWIYRVLHLPERLYRFGIGRKVGPPILILTTKGRRSGQPRRTPLQYEEIGGVYYCGSMRGANADWYRNLTADPRVEVQLGERHFPALAEAIDDPETVLEFLKIRLARSPRMIMAILRADGLQGEPDDAALRSYAKNLTIVALRPSESS